MDKVTVLHYLAQQAHMSNQQLAYCSTIELSSSLLQMLSHLALKPQTIAHM